jgi:hypothetical protein
VHHREHLTLTSRGHDPRPFRGFFPFSVFPAARSHLHLAVPTPPVTLRPRVSHPPDALLPTRPAGLVPSRSRSWGSPFEALFLPSRRTSSRTPSPSWGSGRSPKRLPPAPPGVVHATESPPAGPGFSRVGCVVASLGLVPSEVSCLVQLAQQLFCAASPLALSRLGRKLTSPLAPQGLYHTKRSRSLSRPTQPPWGFSPR